MTERKIRKEIIEKTPDKIQDSVIEGLDRVERHMGVVNFSKSFKSITTDNGREFYDYDHIEESFTKSSIKRTEVYSLVGNEVVMRIIIYLLKDFFLKRHVLKI